MSKDHDESKVNWGVSLGLGAVVGILVSAIVGMLRLSKPKDETQRQATSSQKTALIEDPPENSSPAVGPAMKIPAAGKVKISSGSVKPASAVTSAAGVEAPQPTSTHWSTGTKYFVSALLFLAFLGIIYISSGSITTIIFAALLTFIVHPIIKFFQRRFNMRRGSATLVTYMLVVGLLILIPFLIIPSIVNSVKFLTEIDYLALLETIGEWLQLQASIIAAIPVVGGSLSSGLEELAGMLNDIANQNPQSSSDIEISFQNIGGRISQTMEFLSKVFGPLISIATTVAFTLLISLHMSLSIDLLREGTKKLIPPAYQPEITALVRQIILIWNSFLRGQMSLMVVVGVIVWIGNLFLGTPQALLLGVIAGLLEVIPSLGPILATIPAVILALIFGSGHIPVENWAFALIVIAFYILVQVIENQLLVPYILGDAVDLPPLIVIIGVVIGGSAFGLLGVFLATPVISTGREVFMYLYDKILEPPPEPEIIEEKPSIMDAVRRFAARLPRPNWGRRAEVHAPVVVSEDQQVAEQI